MADEIKAVLKIEEDKESNLDDVDMIMEDNDAVKVEPNYGFSGTIMQMEPKYETMSLDALSVGFKTRSLKHLCILNWQKALSLRMMCLKYSLKVMTGMLIGCNGGYCCFSDIMISHLSNFVYLTLLSFC